MNARALTQAITFGTFPAIIDEVLDFEDESGPRTHDHALRYGHRTAANFRRSDTVATRPCRVSASRYSSTETTPIDSSATYAISAFRDAFAEVVGSRRAGHAVMHEPVVIFELLSKGTPRTDRMVKTREYGATASVRHYVVLEQTAIEGMMFTRTGDGSGWVGEILNGDAVVAMPEIGITLPLAELYANLDLSDPEADEG